MLSHIISLLLFGVATSFSPGPNNIMTAYTMFNFGFKNYSWTGKKFLVDIKQNKKLEIF